MITGAIIGAVVGVVVFLIQSNKKKKQEHTDILDDSESVDSTNKEIWFIIFIDKAGLTHYTFWKKSII